MARSKKVPKSDTQPAARIGEHEVTRRAHIKAETNLRVLGVAGIVFGILCIGLGVTVAFGVMPPNPNQYTNFDALLIGLLSLAQGVLLRQFNPIGRILASVSAVIGIGAKAVTLQTGINVLGQCVWIGLYLWYLVLLWRVDSDVVFSKHYRAVVIPATPRVKPKHGCVTVVLLVLLLMLVVASSFMVYVMLKIPRG